MSSSMMTNRNNTITAPAYTSTWIAARKNASSSTNNPAMNTNSSTKNIALVTGLRFKITSSPAQQHRDAEKPE